MRSASSSRERAAYSSGVRSFWEIWIKASPPVEPKCESARVRRCESASRPRLRPIAQHSRHEKNRRMVMITQEGRDGPRADSPRHGYAHATRGDSWLTRHPRGSLRSREPSSPPAPLLPTAGEGGSTPRGKRLQSFTHNELYLSCCRERSKKRGRDDSSTVVPSSFFRVRG